jgi:hypothetical protein
MRNAEAILPHFFTRGAMDGMRVFSVRFVSALFAMCRDSRYALDDPSLL